MADEGNKGEVTYTSNQDGTMTVKDAAGVEVRFAKEDDLLAVKGSKETAEAKVKELESAQTTGNEAAKTEAETLRQGKLQAEAKVTGLEEKIAAGTATAAELTTMTADLVTAKKTGEEQGTKLLELQKTLIVGTFKVPVATVENKTLEQLEVYAEALTAVTGTKLGNYAAGGGGGGTDLSGKNPTELAKIAYEQKK